MRTLPYRPRYSCLFSIGEWLVLCPDLPSIQTNGFVHSKEDDVSRISNSIFVSNFSDQFSAKDLFNTCKQYGHVIDSFIPLKRTKDGKRFGFVRFINIFSVERLVSNLCMIWVGRNKLGANVAKFSRNNLNTNSNNDKKEKVSKNSSQMSGETESSPAIVLDEDCVNTKDLSCVLMGRVKEFASLSNLKKVLCNEGFDDSKISYLGELWVLLEFESVKTMELFKENSGVNSWFSLLNNANVDFVPGGRVGSLLEIDEYDESNFHSKRLCILSKVHHNILESLKIIFRGKVYWLRAKEVPRWNPKLLEEEDEEEGSMEGNQKGIQSDQDINMVNEESDAEEILETVFDVPEDKDPKVKEVESSLKQPPGFTPNGIDKGDFPDGEYVNMGDNYSSVNMADDKEKPISVSKVADSMGSCRLKKSGVSHSGLAQKAKKDWVRELCINNKVNFVGLQETKMETIELCSVRSCWGRELMIVVVYAPQEASEKRMLWDYLIHISDQWRGDIVIMGDFNEIRHNSERFGSKFNAHNADIFNSFISNAGLNKVHLGGNTFTWCHKSDRFLVFDNVLMNYPNINAISLDRFISDHRPILLREGIFDYGPIPFRFYSYWLEVEGFDKMVKESWNNAPSNKKNAIRSFMYKLKYTKEQIRGWLSANKQNMRGELHNLKDELRMIDEEIDKDSRARIDICFPNTLSDEQRQDLECIVTKEEVKQAVWDCGCDKSPGPDGFSFSFFCHFWSTIKADMFKAVDFFFTYGEIPIGCNSNFIALISKTLDANMVKDFRPISLIGGLYKVIAKVLTNRLVNVIGDLVNEVADFVCGLTDYKEACKVTMTPLANKDTVSLRDVFNASIQATKVAVDDAGMSLVAIKDDNDVAFRQRLDECKELMEYASDELSESSRIMGDQINNTDLGILDKQPELMNLLSAVVAYQETCLDGLDKPELRAKVEDLLLNST
nr:nucleotide-binding alpha-beta plait domain-containing protein [Tanacetum cinerariifolium]